MNFVFFGTPHFSVIVLEGLLRAGLKPALVVTAPDKPTGRKQILTPSPVKEFASTHGLKVATPRSKEELIKIIQPAWNLTTKQSNNRTMFDLGILVAYGMILPSPLLALFPDGILNLHPSLLPKYRGPTPIQTAILNGDAETGVTVMKLNEKIDGGDILVQEKVTIEPNDTTPTLGEKLFKLGAKKLIEILPNYLNDTVILQKQDTGTFLVRACTDDSNHRYIATKKISKQDGFIKFADLQQAITEDKNLAGQIDRKFRAFFPWPGIWTVDKNEKRVLITKCHLERGLLKIDLVKREGKNEEKSDIRLMN